MIGVVAGALCGVDIALQAVNTARVRALTDINDLPDPPPVDAPWPSLAVIVPACNEADTVGPALRRLLESDYPDLRVVVVNDRSTDATGDVVDALAEGDSRVRAVHIDALPDGWLGKVHALHRGSEGVDADWILFTDADVHLSPSALRRAVDLARSRGLDQIGILPDIKSGSALHDAVIGVFAAAVIQSFRTDRLADPDHPAAAGVGAFNLVRGEVWRRTPGFEALRMEIADDAGVGSSSRRRGGASGWRRPAGTCAAPGTPPSAPCSRAPARTCSGSPPSTASRGCCPPSRRSRR